MRTSLLASLVFLLAASAVPTAGAQSPTVPRAAVPRSAGVAGEGSVAAQQGEAGLVLLLPPRESITRDGPQVITRGVLDDRDMRTLITNGFPARLHYRLELWSRGGWFDNLSSALEWDVTVRFEELTKTYRVSRFTGNRTETLGRFTEWRDAMAAVERPYRVPRPARRSRDRQYFNAVLEVTALSNSDLDEVERWLKGELEPSLRGDGDPGTAMGRAMRTLMTRMLGGEARTYTRRSESFRVQD
jgi:hypothetical protein